MIFVTILGLIIWERFRVYTFLVCYKYIKADSCSSRCINVIIYTGAHVADHQAQQPAATHNEIETVRRIVRSKVVQAAALFSFDTRFGTMKVNPKNTYMSPG